MTESSATTAARDQAASVVDQLLGHAQTNQADLLGRELLDYYVREQAGDAFALTEHLYVRAHFDMLATTLAFVSAE